ncbi:hypothetical protein [Melittangium boletus]|uniref:ATP synthase n=1 Tax=Melittangium boletus DSM 14713 TaxID=1294270 RepID=A0A250IF31_9BACT|nr:hypothetical protein [Melittangium boletus]ATB30439.1 ATP synthase [Melittangium boletus DSM 14713]
MSKGGEALFRKYAGLAAVGSVVALALAAFLPEREEARSVALVGVLLAVGTGVVGLLLKRRVAQRDLNGALLVVALVFGMRAVGVVLGLLWVVRRDLDAVAFVAGFFGTYLVLQSVELSYVMAASRDAAGGGE